MWGWVELPLADGHSALAFHRYVSSPHCYSPFILMAAHSRTLLNSWSLQMVLLSFDSSYPRWQCVSLVQSEQPGVEHSGLTVNFRMIWSLTLLFLIISNSPMSYIKTFKFLWTTIFKDLKLEPDILKNAQQRCTVCANWGSMGCHQSCWYSSTLSLNPSCPHPSASGLEQPQNRTGIDYSIH